MPNEQAPAGKVWLCTACAKRSRDKYGDNPIDWGWDESCMLNSQLFDEDEANRLRDDYMERVRKRRDADRT